MKKKILISDIFDTDLLKQYKKKYQIVYLPKITPSKLILIINQYEILLISTRIRITRHILENAKKLKLIIRMGIGVDHIDLKECKKLNIMVCNTPNSNNSPVVELVFGQILRLFRHFENLNKNVINGKFRKGLELGNELKNKTIGIIGVGRIGRKIAKIAKQFEMKVIGNDPYLEKKVKKNLPVDKWLSKEKLILESDIVSLHVPLTDKTMHLVDKKFLDLMKKDSVLINTSRGKVVKLNDVFQFAKKGKIRKFIFDVFEEEPYKPSLNKNLLKYFFFSPHTGAYTKESFFLRCEEAFEEIEEYLKNKKIHGIIDYNKGY